MRLDEDDLYQMMFWIAPDKAGEWALWIGAMQGPNMENARDVVKKVTRRCYSYRTKNFILHATQEVAKALGLTHIYAVTNYGYYANNHVRRDRKLKTSFSDFWEESGGHPCEDRRFYELPMTEYRKAMEEVPAHKRNYYRKRYALLDEVDASIAENIKALSNDVKTCHIENIQFHMTLIIFIVYGYRKRGNSVAKISALILAKMRNEISKPVSKPCPLLMRY